MGERYTTRLSALSASWGMLRISSAFRVSAAASPQSMCARVLQPPMVYSPSIRREEASE